MSYQIDIAISNISNIEKNQIEKIRKCTSLAEEVNQVWQRKKL